ncbi:MAG: hypothetical protein NC395_00505 [Prevotella sp.]|nr:hypothetical protein [Prevotella sp.]
MKCKVENGRLIIEENGNTYSFEAHAEGPRPSLLGAGLSAGGRHWSDRDENIKLEKHTSIQDIALNDKYAAWYIQEFVPDKEGVDYRLTKKAQIYLGVLQSGETKEIYKGECYGDLIFDGDNLLFNMGNKVAVIALDSGEMTVLFKHSGIKKNRISLNITPKRIFFNHWTHDSNHFMWYDRESGEVINPHIDTVFYGILDEDTIIYHGLDYAWKLDLNTLKKKRFFTSKQLEKIRLEFCSFFDASEEYFREYFTAEFREIKNGRLRFKCYVGARSDSLDYNELKQKLYAEGKPSHLTAEMTCGIDGKDIEFPVKNIKKETLSSEYIKSPWWAWSALSEDMK